MHPFCSMVAGWDGGSKARSANPSETKTTTFSKSPLGSAKTSSADTPPGWSLAQLGSAFMLICVDVGRWPTNFTVPFTTAVPGAGLSLAGGRPRAGSRPARNRATVAAKKKGKALTLMVRDSFEIFSENNWDRFFQPCRQC